MLRLLDDLGAVLDEAADLASFGMSPAETATFTARSAAVVARMQALHLQAVALADRVDVAGHVGGTSTAAWLRSTCGLRPGEAGAAVRLARELDGPQQATGAALAAGAISQGQAAAVTGAVAALPAAVGEVVRRRAEAWLLEQATTAGLDPPALDRVGRAVLQVVDPEAADELLAKRLDRDERRAHAKRWLRLTPDPEDAAATRVSGKLDTECAARLVAVLDPLAAPRPAADDGPDLRSSAERLHDGLSEACRRLLAAGDRLPTSGGDPTTVVVTIPVATLLDGVGAATVLRDGDPLSPGEARRWACDAAIIPAVLGTASEPLDLGRRERLFTGRLRRALELRDRGCAFPGCGRPPAWCHGHHIVPWEEGGETSLANGVLVCGHHHRLVHRGDWAIELGPDGHPWFRPPPWIDPARTPRRSWRAPPVPHEPDAA